MKSELEGKTGEISEQNIGERVFGRRENYSPLVDNIVRVSARQLRLKLTEFYDSDGRDDPWVIEIPKGGYVPIFHPREPAQDLAVPKAPVPAASNPRNSMFRGGSLAVLLALAAVLLVVLWGFSRHNSGASAQAESSNNIVLAIFGKTKGPIQIVLSDSALVAMEQVAGHSFTLEDYSNEGYRELPANLSANPQSAIAWKVLANQQIVNVGDVEAALRLRDSLLTLSGEQRPVVHSARDLRARDFRSGSYIVLGGSFANPWVHLLEQKPFNFQFLPGSTTTIVNRNPAAGESGEYSADAAGRGYARIALVPNLTGTGQALLIAGMSMESTEAAVNFCIGPESMELLSALHIKTKGNIPPFEALLQTQQNDGTGVSAKLIDVRLSVPR